MISVGTNDAWCDGNGRRYDHRRDVAIRYAIRNAGAPRIAIKAEAAEVAHLDDIGRRHLRSRRSAKSLGALNGKAAEIRPQAKIEAVFTIVFAPPTTLMCNGSRL